MSRHGVMAALGPLPPRLNPATNNRDGREGEDARLWKRVRTLETNLGYSNLALDDFASRPELGAKHLLCRTNDYRSQPGHGQQQHRKKRGVPGSGPPSKLFQGPVQIDDEEDNKKSVPSLSPLPYSQKSISSTQPQKPFAQRTAALHRNRLLDRLPAPSKEGDKRRPIQAGPPGSITAVVVSRGSLARFCGDGGFLPPCADASQRLLFGATANDSEPEVRQSSPRSVQHSIFSMEEPFVPAGASNTSPSGVRSSFYNSTARRVEPATESVNADDRAEGTFDFNKPDVSTRSNEFFAAAAADTIRTNTTTCFSQNPTVGQHDFDDGHHVEKRMANNEVVVSVDQKTVASEKPRKLRIRAQPVVPPGQKLRTIRAGYCRSLVSPNNPLTSNTVVARVKEGLQSGCEKRPKVLLVGSGTFNPVHKLHIRRFYLARNFLEAHKGMRVVGGIVSPSHPTLVRQRHRVRAAEIIPPKHRLSMARAAVGEGSWLAVDPWEVTRKRIMDYMSVLEHAREVCQETFPSHAGDISIVYMCQTSQIHHLNPTMLRTGGFGLITVCRPLEKERLLKELSPSLRNIAILVEDSAILSAELERTSSTMVRHLLKQGKSVEGMVGKAVARYIRDNDIAQRVSGKHRWTVEDNAFMFEQEDKDDRPYHNLPRIYMRRASQMPLHY